MIVGFTGTQYGMTPIQACAVLCVVEAAGELHHGDCIGADVEAHGMAQGLNVPVVLHPPDDLRKRAFCKGAITAHDPRPYLIRNRSIVEESDALVAAPVGDEHVWKRSGTWMTVRYARSRGRPITIVMPDGKIVRQFWL